MRGIKFRVFDQTIGEMFFNVTTLDVEQGIYMQYTGLKDKNGTEIYEGDILRVLSSGLLCQVVYDKPSFCRKWIDKVSMRHRKLIEPMAWNTHIIYEVIGNIYEHKHLLEGK